VKHHLLKGGRYGRPGWGRGRGRSAHRGKLFCCGRRKKIQKPTVIGYSSAMSWKQANTACKGNGMGMCNYFSMCPKGPHHKPWHGVWPGNAHRDSWSPVGGEGDNQWIQLGRRWPTCLRHTSIQGGRHGRPSWGRVSERGTHHGPIMCCGKPKVVRPITQLATRTAGFSWNDAHNLCRSSGATLCNFVSLCNKWKGVPAVGRKHGDVWIPAGGESRNTWVQIGRKPWPACVRHSEIPVANRNTPWGRPGWGNNRSRPPYKGPVLCCGKIRPRKAKRMGTSSGKSWNDSNSFCQRKGKMLCRYIDLCKGFKPRVTKLKGDQWVPIGGEGDNQWLQLGVRWPVCNRHTEIQGGRHGRPGWGLNRHRYPHKGPIYCC